ncbi:3-deoxy-D-manno-octulosonic acid transferase [bacterium]|nr:3-deoxy-D-manno-octulosonic acid transferase [bacterium]
MLANLIYLLALVAVSPLALYRSVRHGRYRRGLGQKLLGLSAKQAERFQQDINSNDELTWFHAVSVGEVNLLPGLIKHLQSKRDSRLRFVVSTSTDTGYDLAVQHFGKDAAFFCPLDFTWAVKRTLKNLKPKKLVLVELELWPNLIRSATRFGCEVNVINARLSERSGHRYEKFTWITRPLFANLHRVGCQDSLVLERFARCGTPQDRMSITGSLKFDNAPTTRDTGEVIACRRWAGAEPTHRIWIVGSTQRGEEKMALEVFSQVRSQFPDLRLILVPRHQERFDEVASLIESNQFHAMRRSKKGSNQSTDWPQDRVILVDTIGELRNWWGTGDIATVGGSFGNRGGQNMLEPAGYGCAVSFGPNTRNFKEIANALIENNGAVRVQNAKELEDFLLLCLKDPEQQKGLGQRAKELVNQHRGAIERTAGMLQLNGTIHQVVSK